MSQQFPSNGVAPAPSGPRVVHSSQPIFFRTALAAAISLVGLNAQAQTAPADATTLPPIVVSATGYPQPLANALPSVSVITREQIGQSGAQNLTTLLQQVAGVQVTSNGGPGQSGNVYVRGFGGPDVLVLLDGVPMNAQDTTGVAYLNNFTADQIQRIEIIRGNVSAIYGSGAIGGVVLITTRAGSKKPQASISVTAGSRNTATVSANASGQVGNTALQAGVSRYTTQGVSAINPAQLSNANPNSNGYGNTTMNGSIVQTLAPGQSLGLRVFSSKGRASYDSYGAYARPTDTNLSSTSQDLYQLFSDNQLTAAWKSHLSVSQQSTTNTTENFSAYPYSGTYRTRVQQLLWRNVVQLGSGWTATGGLEWQSQAISSITGSIPSRDRHAKAAFVGLDGSVNGNELQLNLRHDAIDGYSGQNTGYFGYGRELGSGFKAIASYSTAFNAAPLGYLYAPYYGNANLKAEKAHSVEAGLQWSQGANVLRATLFQTKATDQWQYDFTTSTFQNIASSRTRGLELTGRGAWKGWAYDANLTLQQPADTSKPGDPTLQRRARSLANVSVIHEFASVLYGAAVHYSGPRWDNGSTGRVTLGSYTTVDLTASGAVSKDWSWNARVQNLFNKKYQTVYGYNREPLGVFVGLTWRPAF
ncbi:TonB-dependent receptor domain-containing protein [Thiomonas sp. OC7]|uniref:TonB-dependent receptor domain-containing protein n=1 Tax=Thiomonas sp. OC7 TaxID=2493107 RepID=UPI0004DBA51D|nr:TonB-dependent receptor [Thiomonas sp. OC7]CDW95694.1 TonB-dependent receptor plug [Thiomonas sp. CB2]CQR42134.1 TonB-dependent receptor plug [Thiomonas sp. CB3]VDY03385.1 TonB-dependent receptor plug [Thiomonas sp. Bio17B3]VDY09441.1 TonB-dependent receptor plug [Thiomonas sp. Sup16B3]VDY11633.1 putative Porin [Thiomonas sp. OC7]